jgi:hypothetical protein
MPSLSRQVEQFRREDDALSGERANMNIIYLSPLGQRPIDNGIIGCGKRNADAVSL